MKRLIKILTFGFLSLVGMALPTLVFSDDYWIPGSGSGAPVEISTTYADDTPLYFGTSGDALITYSTLASPDSWVIGVGADSNILYIAEKADYATVWNRSAPANPTVCIQSADATTQAQRICLSHNQTDGLIDVDSGQVSIPDGIKSSAAAGIVLTGTNSASGSANPFDLTSTLAIMNGDDTFIGLDVNITNANHTGDPDSNILKALNISGITGDDETVETAIYIGNGWDVGIDMNATNLMNALVVESAVFTGSAISVTNATVDTINGLEEINGIQGGGGDIIGLIIQVPDQGASNDEPGTGIQILADNGGSDTVGAGGGGILIQSGDAQGSGDNSGGNINLVLGDFTGAGERGYFTLEDSDGHRILLAQPVNGIGVNYLSIVNGVTGTGPTITTVGSDANPDLNLTAQGAGSVAISPSLSIKNGSSTILTALNDLPDTHSGDLVQVQINAAGGGTITGSADAYRAFRIDAILTTGTQTALFRGEHIQVKATGAAVSSGAGGIGLRAAHFAGIWDSTGTADNVYGIQTNAVLLDSSSSVAAGTVQNLVANNAVVGFTGTAIGSGNAVNAYGFYINTPQNTSVTRTIGTVVGLKVEDMVATGVTTAYSIQTGTGRVSLGGNIDFSTGTATDSTLFGIARNADSPNALEYYVPSTRIHKWTIAGATEMTLSATALDFQNNSLTTTGGGSLTGTWTNLGSVTTIDINGGTLDGTIIGGSSAAAATVTTLSMNNLITFTGGSAITAGSYQCGRDVDATSQYHCNVPTGASFEFSINDVPEYVWTSTDLNLNNNTLSNIGAAGTDFLNDGRLVISTTASGSGTVALTLTQGNHTALSTDQPALNITAATITVNSGSTVGTATTATIGAITYNGVAGGGAEQVTSAASLRIVSAPIQGTNITLTNTYALWVDADSARFDGRILGAQGGDVASAATITLGSGNFFHITGTTNIDCITTTGWTNGSTVTLEFDGALTVNDSTGGCGAGTSNVDIGAAYTTTANDTITLVLDGGSWDEKARSVN